MTFIPWGMLVPIQAQMISLLGYPLYSVVVERDFSTLADIPDDERYQHMKWGRCQLVLDTGEDFRFDVAAWREYLLQNEEDTSYLWNGGQTVEREVLAAIADPAWHAFAAAMPADDAHEKDVLECLERHKFVRELLAVEQAERDPR